MIGLQRQVGAEQLMRIAQERLAHAVAEERHARDARLTAITRAAASTRSSPARQSRPSMRSACLMRRSARASRTTRLQRPARALVRASDDERRAVFVVHVEEQAITPAPESASRLPVGSSRGRSLGRTRRRAPARRAAARRPRELRIVIERSPRPTLSSISLDSLSAFRWSASSSGSIRSQAV